MDTDAPWMLSGMRKHIDKPKTKEYIIFLILVLTLHMVSIPSFKIYSLKLQMPSGVEAFIEFLLVQDSRLNQKIAL